jgi:hypothetical protein
MSFLLFVESSALIDKGCVFLHKGLSMIVLGEYIVFIFQLGKDK